MKPFAAILAMAPALLFAGCGGGEYLQVQADAHRQTSEAIRAFAGREAEPRLAIEFHEDGRVKSIAMYDAQPLPRVPEFRPAPHPGWGLASAAATALLPALGSSLTIWAAGEAFEEVISHTSGASNVTTTTTTTNEEIDSRDMSVRTQDNDSTSTVVRNSNVGGRDAGDPSISTAEETTTTNTRNDTRSVNEETVVTTTEDNSIDLDYGLDYTFRPNPTLFPEDGQ